MRTTLLLTVLLAASVTVQAQDMPTAAPADVESPETIVQAVYASLERAPGDQFDWDRFLSLYLPEAILMPNTEQLGGSERRFTPQKYVDYIQAIYDAADYIGSPADTGFEEKEIHNVTHRLGDVAQVFSTYDKFAWQGDESLGRGINSFQLAYRGGRWWIVSGIWDEETGAGPIPDQFLSE
ncbi:hypothetical protein [Rubrivirga sp.]|uniref:hypothetical protein n=1 Tax=Rubrivirga sp. TaxID=1885344 RepID=UPI003C73E7DC